MAQAVGGDPLRPSQEPVRGMRALKQSMRVLPCRWSMVGRCRRGLARWLRPNRLFCHERRSQFYVSSDDAGYAHHCAAPSRYGLCPAARLLRSWLILSIRPNQSYTLRPSLLVKLVICIAGVRMLRVVLCWMTRVCEVCFPAFNTY